MTNNLSKFFILLLVFFALNGATNEGTKVKPAGGCATTTSTKSGTEAKQQIQCIPPEKRSIYQKLLCKFLSTQYRGRLCKWDVDCLKLKSEKTEEEKEILKEIIVKQAICAHFSYEHIAIKSTFILQEPKEGSLQVMRIKKGEELSSMQRVKDNQSWILVANKDCDQGFIHEKFVRGKDEDIDPPPPPPQDKDIILTSHEWAKTNELIVVSRSGFFDIEGRVSKSVDRITLNDEELTIESDKSFSQTLLIKKEDLDIRIVAYKDGEQVDKLTFIVKIK